MLTVRGVIIGICIVLFAWNRVEEWQILAERETKGIGMATTPIQRALFFDYPKVYGVIETWMERHHAISLEQVSGLSSEDVRCAAKLKKLPLWKGLWNMWMEPQSEPIPPLFEKIREGQLWRVFTPCLLHADFVHILFNLFAFWVLAKQVEEKLSTARLLLLMGFIGSIANAAQYITAGPFFMGISGIVVGLVGFIWMRQKKAPWEGYPLHKLSILFVFVLVGLMWVVELFSMLIQWVAGSPAFMMPIANTAHIVGGIAGALCGRLSFFSRSHT